MTPLSSALLAENIKSGTTIFNVLGTYGGSALVPRTGQILCYDPSSNVVTTCGADGATLKGVTWPSPRFTNNNNGTVTDNLTGLIWLKNVNCFGTRKWADALTDCNTLANGTCDLTDRSVSGSWRLPNRSELLSLLDIAYFTPALSNNDGTGQWVTDSVATSSFKDVQSGFYWSSTSRAADLGQVWSVHLGHGCVAPDVKTPTTLLVWPVRGGQ